MPKATEATLVIAEGNDKLKKSYLVVVMYL